MATGFRQVLDHFQQAGGGLTDGQLLARFASTRDEGSFAALVRRHGPMVLGVCRRVLRDFHDAEDAFQATFLVLAQKAASVVKRESVSCWLHGVAYHTALRAGAAAGRRRARERPMSDRMHPEVMPAEARDWLPVLDRELGRLGEKYRAAIVLCDLEGKTRKEAARLLRVPEGTLSSRLATGRQLLARRLSACGVALSGGALAVALSQGGASAAVPAALVSSTAKVAALVAAGQMVGAAAPAVVLMRGVMKAMLMKKLRVAVGTVMVLAAFGMVGVGYRAGGFGAAQAAPPDKPQNELEALRKENDLLKLNLQVVLEKVRAQEGEIQGLRKDVAARDRMGNPWAYNTTNIDLNRWSGLSAVNGNLLPPNYYVVNGSLLRPSVGGTWEVIPLKRPGTIDTVRPPNRDTVSDATKEAEAAVKALRAAKDKEGRRKAADALDKAMKKLREGLK